MDIAEFLLARITEDEARVKAFADSDGFPRGMAVRKHWRIQLAECDARRRIVEIHKPWYGSYECPTCADGAGLDHGEVVVDRLRAPCPTLRALALPYAHHPDYEAAWSGVSV